MSTIVSLPCDLFGVVLSVFRDMLNMHSVAAAAASMVSSACHFASSMISLHVHIHLLDTALDNRLLDASLFHNILCTVNQNSLCSCQLSAVSIMLGSIMINYEAITFGAARSKNF